MINRQRAALAIAAMMAVLLAAGWPALAASIATSKHNLSASGAGTIKAATEVQICVFCHVPHRAQPTGPLWNRGAPAGPYTPYTSTTRKIVAPGAPTRASLLCLSCHDGTIALGKISSRVTAIPTSGRTNFLTGDLSYLGTDLSDDHPVSFLYTSVLTNPELRTPTGAVKLDTSGQMQCTACHSPHDDANGKFLVVNNIRSALCTNCHNKSPWAASSHATSTKTKTATTAPWGANPWANTTYVNVRDNACENCHQPHTAPNKKRLLKFASEEGSCLVCHNGDVAAAGKRIDAELSKVSKHAVGSYLNVHDAAEANLMGAKHAECVDCHNPHATNATAGSADGTTPVTLPGALNGVRGITLSGTDIAAVTHESQICFRCHGDSLNRGPAPSTARQYVETNTRLEFATTAKSRHPVGAARTHARPVPSLIAPWDVNDVIKCTDCHSNNAGPGNGGTGPRGPHGSTQQLLLERTYTSSGNYTAATQQLCYKCHSETSILANQSFRMHRYHLASVNNPVPCGACHEPHGVASASANSFGRLINFRTDTSAKPYVTQAGTEAIRWEQTSATSGRCYLVCHMGNGGNITHNATNKTY